MPPLLSLRAQRSNLGQLAEPSRLLRRLRLLAMTTPFAAGRLQSSIESIIARCCTCSNSAVNTLLWVVEPIRPAAIRADWGVRGAGGITRPAPGQPPAPVLHPCSPCFIRSRSGIANSAAIVAALPLAVPRAFSHGLCPVGAHCGRMHSMHSRNAVGSPTSASSTGLRVKASASPASRAAAGMASCCGTRPGGREGSPTGPSRTAARAPAPALLM